MNVTLWKGLTDPNGASGEVSWEEFLAFVRDPVEAEDKTKLEGFSLAKFKGDRRAKSNVEEVSSLALDDDESCLAIDQLASVWRGCAGVIFTTHSHTPRAPRYRIVLQLSRDVTASEYARLWAWAKERAGFVRLDEATKDASRFWFVPAKRPGGVYEVFELKGEPINVDAILAASVSEPKPAQPLNTPAISAAPASRVNAAAAMLAAAWPAKGRHQAQLALAGALRNDGWSKEAALEFLCAVCRAAGDENRSKRIQTIEHTWSKAPGEPLTGWNRLRAHVDGAVVSSARDVLSSEADFKERIAQKLESARQTSEAKDSQFAQAERADDGTALSPGRGSEEPGILFNGWTDKLEPPKYIIESYVPEASVGLLIAHGDSVKTWTLLSMCLALASGKPWLGVYAVQPGVAVLADYESGNYELARRVQMLGPDGSNGKLGRWCFPNFPINKSEFWESLIGFPDLRLVGIDSLAAGTFGVDENLTEAAEPMKLAAKFSELTGAAVAFIHHRNKGDRGDVRESVRGSSALFAAADWVYAFEPIEETESHKRMRLTPIKMSIGRKPKPLAIELTDAGLKPFAEEAREVAQKAETPAMLRAAVRLALAKSPGITANRLVKDLGKNKKAVLAELNELVESRDAVHLKTGFALDSDERRTERILEQLAAYSRWTSEAQLAKAAYVTTRDVEERIRGGLITRSGEGALIAVER